LKRAQADVQLEVKFSYLRKKEKCPKGFTLVETVIAVMLVVVLGLVCAEMVAYFAKYTRQDTLRTCLLQAASSGIEAKRADASATSITVSCSGYNADVKIEADRELPNPAPKMGDMQSACATITSTSTIEGKTMILRDLICNFPEGDG